MTKSIETAGVAGGHRNWSDRFRDRPAPKAASARHIANPITRILDELRDRADPTATRKLAASAASPAAGGGEGRS